jgi:hypothetical protein
LILATGVALSLTPLIVAIDAQAQIAFVSKRDGNFEIYVMDADGGNQKNLTNHPEDDEAPAWFNSPFSVSPAGKKFTMWGRLKQVNR